MDNKLTAVQQQIAQIQQLNQLLANPAALQQLLAASQPATAPVQPAPVQQSPTVTVSESAKLIDAWVAEFTQKEPDEGKQLSSSLTKFARFVQSKVAKPEPTPSV